MVRIIKLKPDEPKRKTPPKPGTETYATWGRSPFSGAGPDEADGVRIGGYRLIRSPSGELVGLVDKPDEPR